MIAAATKTILEDEISVRFHARDSFIVFSKYIFPQMQINWHHIMIAKVLQKFASGEIKKLMLFAPPQTGKSQLSSRHLPAYILGKEPDAKIALAAYSPTHASAFNRDIQRIITSNEYKNIFPGTKINDKNVSTDAHGAWLRNKDIFEVIEHGGFLKSVGIGSPLTGTSVKYAIIDDPIKDHVEAYSKIYRDRVWDWWDTVLTTRLDNNSQILLTLTRWHEDDLSGRLLQLEGDEWTVVSFPAINEAGPSDYDIREIGEVLWPEKHSLERMLKKKEKSPQTFISLYQQRPSAEEGNIIKREHFTIISIEDVPLKAMDQRIDFVVDTAYTDKTKNDPSAYLAYYVYENDLYLWNYRSVRMEFSDLCDDLESFVHENGSPHSKVFIEPKASGKSVKQYLKKHTPLNVIEYAMESGSKEERAYSIEPYLAAGRVKVIQDKWNIPFIGECMVFPNGSHDESVDLLVMAITNGLARKSNHKSKAGRRVRSII